MSASLSWEELQLVLAISRTGSLTKAAHALGVHHSTAFRRLERAEERARVTLFRRAHGRYEATAVGANVAEHAARMEDELLGVERALADRDSLPRGEVRLTTVPSLVETLIPALRRLAEQCPELHIALDATPAARALERGDADLALRPTAEPPPEVIGTRLSDLVWATYRCLAETASAEHIHYTGELGANEHTRRRPGDDHASHVSVATVPSMLQCIVAGLGQGRLPCYVGDADVRLRRVGDVVDTGVGLWLLSPVELRKSARVRATKERLIECLRPELPRFAGDRAATPTAASRAGN